MSWEIYKEIRESLFVNCLIASMFIILGMRMLGIGNLKYNAKTIFGIAFVLFALGDVLFIILKRV